MEIEIWNETSLSDQSVRSDVNDPIGRAVSKYIGRQGVFYKDCAIHLHKQNATWTTFHDVDEYFALDFERTAWPGNDNRTAQERMQQPGSILATLREVRNRMKNGTIPTDEQYNGTCVVTYRRDYGFAESSPRDVAKDVPVDVIDPQRFDTLRFRHYGNNIIGKSIFNVQNLKPNATVHTDGTRYWHTYGRMGAHRVLPWCPFPFYRKNHWMVVNHYVGRWEDFSNRKNDPRFRGQAGKDPGQKTRDHWIKNGNVSLGTSDTLRLWAAGFVQHMGKELTSLLLAPEEKEEEEENDEEEEEGNDALPREDVHIGPSTSEPDEQIIEDEAHFVPRILHMIHISSDLFSETLKPEETIPTDVEANVRAWRDLLEPLGWKVILWDNQRIRREFPSDLALLKLLLHFAWMTDLLRYKVVYRYGGVYLDTDILPIRSIEPLRKFNFSVCQEGNEKALSVTEGIVIENEGYCKSHCNAVIGATPYHPALWEMERIGFERTMDKRMENFTHYYLGVTGPWAWSNVARMDPTFVTLKDKTFYPCKWTNKTGCNVSYYMDDAQVFAMHNWAGTWLNIKPNAAT